MMMMGEEHLIKLVEGLMKEYVCYLRGGNKEFFSSQDHPHIVIAKKGLDIFKESVYAFVREQFKGVATPEKATLEKVVKVKEQVIESHVQVEIKRVEESQEGQKIAQTEKKEEKGKVESQDEENEYFSCYGDSSDKKLSQIIELEQQIRYPSHLSLTPPHQQEEVLSPPQPLVEDNPINSSINHEPIQEWVQEQDSLISTNQTSRLQQQSRVFTSICTDVASYSLKNKQSNLESLQKIISLVNYTQNLFRNRKDGVIEQDNMDMVKIGKRIIDILSEQKVRKIKELSLRTSTRNMLRMECDQLAHRIDLLF